MYPAVYNEAISGRANFLTGAAAITAVAEQAHYCRTSGPTGRGLGVQLQLVGLLCSKGITLISADTQQDITAAFSGDPMLKAMIQGQGVFAKLDKSILVKKLRKASEQVKAKEGLCGQERRFTPLPTVVTTHFSEFFLLPHPG